MPIESNCNIRIANNNLLKNSLTMSYPTITPTSADTTNIFNNCMNDKRYEYFSFETFFDISATTNLIYINDGSNKTASITIGYYTTGVLLATEIQTQLNTVSSNWTVTYANNRFSISNTGSVTLRFSQTTNSAWDAIGFTSITDETNTLFIADEIRNHTYEQISIDFGGQIDVGFCAMIGPSGEEFSFSDNSTITLYGNNINNWVGAPFSIELSVDDDGAYAIVDEANASFRYFWIRIEDRRNPDYNPKISNMFLGEYLETDFNITPGYGLGKADRSVRVETEAGVLFHDVKKRYWEYSVNYGIISKEDLTRFMALWDEATINYPFYISIDPRLNFTESRKLNTKFVYFQEQPSFQHVFYDKFSFAMSVREAL